MKKKSISIIVFQFLAFTVFLLFSCKKSSNVAPADVTLSDIGSLFIQTNETSGNRILQYNRSESGKLTYVASYETRGLGTSAGLGNQGSIILSDNKKFVIVTNAQSNDISTFKFDNNKLIFVGVYPSLGIKPISVTQKGNLVYVLNVSSDQVAGFTISDKGELIPIAGSIQSLSGVNVLGAQISFVRPNVLVVTERQSNNISTFVLNNMGSAGNRQTVKSFTNTPFGFGVGAEGRIYVTEENVGVSTGGQLSSYAITPSGDVNFISTFRTGELGICWAVVNSKETAVFATNTTNNTISSFGLTGVTGVIKTHFISQNLGSGFAPIDIALSKNDNFVYVLNSKSNQILGYAVADGALAPVSGSEISRLPIAANGLAVY
ncbi:MAG: beta-propeller fold lactonase family protein [Mucilaginibacter sp.]